MRAAWWWVDRWRKSTAYTDMTAEQQGVYRNLLDELWLRDGLLPLDERILRKIGGDHDAWPRVRDVVLARFEKTEAGYRNATHDEVASFAKDFRDSQAEKGRKGAAKRWSGHVSANGPANGPANSPANGLPSPSPSPDQNKNPPTPLRGKPAPPAVGSPKKRKAVADVEAELSVIEPWIATAVRSWLAYRTEKRLGDYTPTGLRALVGTMRDMGTPRVRAAMQFSMSRNYQGLIEPNVNGHARTNEPAPKTARDVLVGSAEWIALHG